MTEDRAIQRRMAAYAHAVGEALAHVPAADRESILEDLEEHIDDALRAAGGDRGLEQLEAVLTALGSPEAYAADLQVPGPAEPVEPRLCKKAVLGLLWSASFVLVAVPSWLVVRLEEPGAGPSLGERLFQFSAFLSLAGALGGPVLSAIALTQIRLAAGRLSGFGMATVGAWLPPLLVIDVLAMAAISAVVEIFVEDGATISALQGAGALLILIATAVFLSRAARRGGPRPAA
ncbi:MAG: hypothetical protein ISR76_10115, partial [Planctomycetes bacterium]|nr:hypothetical protein [Planctomycetota bacterium]